MARITVTLKRCRLNCTLVDEQIHQELQQIIKRAQADFQLAQQTEDEIRRRFDEQQAAASKLNEKTVQFAVLSQEAYSRKKLYEDLYTKLQEANVSAGLKATNITVVDPARSQSVPVLPKRRANLALGMLFGIFVGLSSAFAIDNLDRTVTDPLEVEEITGRPVIGVIPIFGEKGRTYGARLAHQAQRLANMRTAITEDDSISKSVWMLERPEFGRCGSFPGIAHLDYAFPSRGRAQGSSGYGLHSWRRQNHCHFEPSRGFRAT